MADHKPLTAADLAEIRERLLASESSEWVEREKLSPAIDHQTRLHIRHSSGDIRRLLDEIDRLNAVIERWKQEEALQLETADA